MPNISGPRQPQRKVLASVATSILTYSKSRNVNGRSQQSTGSAPSRYPTHSARYLTMPCAISREWYLLTYWHQRGSSCMSNEVVPKRNKKNMWQYCDNREKLVCGQQFRHNRYEETPSRGAGAQKDEETNNNGFLFKAVWEEKYVKELNSLDREVMLSGGLAGATKGQCWWD